MGETTAIAWTQHTFNPYWGCTKISPGCDHCYAETCDKRVHGVGKGHWGKDAPRRTFGDAHWNEPLKWNRAAGKAGKPALVFCASMADWCDADAPPGTLECLHALWRATPWLRWQMLTKRPARIARSLPADWGTGYPNVWLGTTVESQEYADQRIPVLLAVPAVVRFLSMEPLLGPVRLHNLLWLPCGVCNGSMSTPVPGGGTPCVACLDHQGGESGIHWVIVGGESGHSARPFTLAWARSLKVQCEGAGVSFFMKQLGACASDPENGLAGRDLLVPDEARALVSKRLKDAKGGDMAEWPEDLRVQQFPPY